MSNSISIATAQQFSRAAVPGRYVLDGRPQDHFSPLLRARAIDGHEVRVNLVDATSLTSHATTVAATGVSVSASLPAFSTRTGKMAHFSGILETDSLIGTRYGNRANLLRELINIKVGAVLDLWRTMLIDGDETTSGEFDGLTQIATDLGTSFTAVSNPESGAVMAGNLENLAAVLDAQGAMEHRYFVMNATAFEKIYANYYSGQIEWIDHPVVGRTQAITGVPVLLNDFIPISGDTTTIYAVLLDGPGRLEAIFPAAQAGREIRVEGPFLKESSEPEFYRVNFDAGLVALGTAVAKLEAVDVS